MSIRRISFFHPLTAMSVRAKLRLSAAITVGLALLVALTVSLQYKNIGQASRTERFAHEMVKNVSDLNSLGYTYLLLQNKRPQAQWQIKHGTLGRLLSEYTVRDPNEELIMARLRSNLEQVKSLFDI
ncbi:MAG TPA: hypothetical protein VGJ94_02935, partial [Syntrophorhabdaceae bacterium]